MTTLAESFLEDMEELGDDFSDISEEEEVKNGNDMEIEEQKEEKDEESVPEIIITRRLTTKEELRHTESYQHHMSELNQSNMEYSKEKEYEMVLISNAFMTDVEDEVIHFHKLILEGYALKFPELESLVPNPMDYIRVVQMMKNEMDMSKVNLNALLPSATVMGVSVTGCTTSGTPLPKETLSQVLYHCQEALLLEEEKKIMLNFVQNRMNEMAPNTSAILGTQLTAQIVGLAGGLGPLSRTPSCNVQVMGQKKRVLSGFSSASTMKHTGLIYYCDLVQNAPPFLRQKACRAVAGKVTLAARIDEQLSHSKKNNPQAGLKGQHLREDLESKIEKWQEAPKAKTKKALKAPDDRPRRKRGGKRYRKQKERLQMTDVRREANRLTFATAGDEYGDSAMGKTFGRLGQEGSGLRVIAKEQKKIAKKLKAASYASGSSGLASSLAFTPVQGLELMNPEAEKQKVAAANKKWFSDSGFSFQKKN